MKPRHVIRQPMEKDKVMSRAIGMRVSAVFDAKKVNF